MAKRKVGKAKAGKQAKRSSPRKNGRSAQAKTSRRSVSKASKARPTRKPRTPQASTAAERRSFRRRETPNLWVTEYSSDYRFVTRARDISEGGIFLLKRMKTASSPSMLTINLGEHGPLHVTAEPIYDRITKETYGTGYRFTGLSDAQSKTLRSFLRYLD